VHAFAGEVLKFIGDGVTKACEGRCARLSPPVLACPISMRRRKRAFAFSSGGVRGYLRPGQLLIYESSGM
jgi:hypothetical protein